MLDEGVNMMKKYEIPEIKITYFATDDTMTATDPTLNFLSVLNVFGNEKPNAQIGNLDFEELK